MGRSGNRTTRRPAAHRKAGAAGKSTAHSATAGGGGPPRGAALARRVPQRTLRVAGALALLVAVLGAGLAWRRGWLPSAAVDRSELRPISLPNLSPLDPEARAQIEQAYDELNTLAAETSADPAALGAAYGRLGSLLLAYDQTGAEAPLDNAERLAPREPRWPYYLGRVHRLAGDFERAADAYARARDVMPEYVPARLRIAQMVHELGRDEEAEALLAAVVEDDPRAAVAHDLLGQIAADRGEHEQAVAHFEAALALQPQATSIYSPLALAYEKAGRTEESRAALARAGIVRPTVDDPIEAELEALKVGVNAWLAQADRALQSGHPENAVPLYERVVAAEPDHALAHFNLGVARSQSGDGPAGLEALRRAVDLDPANAEFQQALAEALAAAGRSEESDAVYRDALARDPRSLAAQLGLAESLRRGGRCEEALPNYSAALELAPTDAVARVQRVFCLVVLGRHAEAIADLEAAQSAQPDDPDLADALARLLSTAPDPALRDGRRAVALAHVVQEHRQGIDALETMAMALAAAGSFASATPWQQRAIDLAKKEGETAWLEVLRADLERYRQHETAASPWPPYVLTPAGP